MTASIPYIEKKIEEIKGQKEQAVDTRIRYHVIAIVLFHDERNSIKVLPRVLLRILNYYNKVLTTKGVKDILLYMSKDIFFNRFPNSSAFNVQSVDEKDVEAHLTDAEKMGCDGKNIIRNR